MNSYAQLPFYTNLERYFMKQRIMLTIAAMTVEISHVKNQLEKMKGDNSHSVFDWSTALGLAEEVADKSKIIFVNGSSMSIKDVLNQVAEKRKVFHYTAPCFSWNMVNALVDVVENQYTFGQHYFFTNENGATQVQKSKTVNNGDWVAIKENNEFSIFKVEGAEKVLIDKAENFEDVLDCVFEVAA